ncbi:MAG: ATP-dependent sacrificial sulfur transferase LarE [Phycisphaerae bacterium]
MAHPIPRQGTPTDALTDLDAKYERLRRRVAELGSVVVAFSGGADSMLLLKVAVDTLGADNVLAVTAGSPSIPSLELRQTGELAGWLGVEHMVVATAEFQDEQYLSNPTNRCYFCKTALYDALKTIADEREMAAVVNGANVDDLGDYRPGLTAAREQDAQAPMADAGLTKADVRALSDRLGLPTAHKPASPCLSSRVPYGERITTEKLRMIEAGETILRKLGIELCRVRHHDTVARIEVPPECFARLTQADVAGRLDDAFRAIGFQYVTLDLRGFRSGSLNEVVPLSVLGPKVESRKSKVED